MILYWFETKFNINLKILIMLLGKAEAPYLLLHGCMAQSEA